MGSPKVLILRPGPGAGGGVNYYYTSLREHFPSTIDFIFRGARKYPFRSGFYREFLRIVADYFNYLYILVTRKYDIVHINTTLDKRGVLRDVFYLCAARLFRVKVIVFFRGWDEDFQKIIENKYLKLFKRLINYSDAIITLFSGSNDLIRKWGYLKPIYVETTTVDVNLTSSISKEFIENRNYRTSDLNILYLARIEKGKGIYICLDTIRILANEYTGIILHIAGNGTEYNHVIHYIEERNMKNVVLHGFVKDQAKAELFKNSHFFLFPTFYKEGMPNAVLEAMAFGLPVITRPVAGLQDVIINGENGFVSESMNAEDFADIIRKSMQDPEKLKKIGLHNFNVARQKFYSNVVAERIMNIYNNVLNS
jgi:glycosyltransferase involved in cell wall biosynthesis